MTMTEGRTEGSWDGVGAQEAGLRSEMGGNLGVVADRDFGLSAKERMGPRDSYLLETTVLRYPVSATDTHIGVLIGTV